MKKFMLVLAVAVLGVSGLSAEDCIKEAKSVKGKYGSYLVAIAMISSASQDFERECDCYFRAVQELCHAEAYFAESQQCGYNNFAQQRLDMARIDMKTAQTRYEACKRILIQAIENADAHLLKKIL